MNTKTNNRSRRIARKISDTLHQAKTLEQRIKFVESDPELSADDRETAVKALRNINAETQSRLNTLRSRQSELPQLPVVPTNMSTNVQESIFSTRDLDGRRVMMSRGIKCARAFRSVSNSRSRV